MNWYDRISRACHTQNVAISKMLKAVGFSPSYFQYYLVHEIMPSREVLTRVAHYLAIKPSSIPGFENAKPLRSQSRRPKSLSKPETGLCNACKFCTMRDSSTPKCIVDSCNHVKTDIRNCEMWIKKAKGEVPTQYEIALLQYFKPIAGSCDTFIEYATAEKLAELAVECRDKELAEDWKGERNLLSILLFRYWQTGKSFKRGGSIEHFIAFMNSEWRGGGAIA